MQDCVVDLESCAREPIHIPGAIQPHGVLLVLRPGELGVLQVSENCEALLGVSVERVLAEGLPSILNEVQIRQVRFALDSGHPEDNNPVNLDLTSLDGQVKLDGVVHGHDGLQFLELEPSTAASSSYFLEFFKKVSRTTERLQRAETMKLLLADAVAGFRQITGHDRVMVYRFAESGEGEVIAESKVDSLESFYGLWYPASDIPEQARRMYLSSPIRSIPDARYVPVPLTPTVNPDTRYPTDLSYASLRSVSPIHCEYLQNMGVSASMSVSIVRNGRLWGLVACHHRAPLLVPYETRKACTFLGQVLSGEIGRRESEEESAYIKDSTSSLAKLLEQMAATQPLAALVGGVVNVMDVIPSTGAAVVVGERVRAIGTTPSFEEMLELTRSLRQVTQSGLFATASLKNHVPSLECIRTTAAGVIAIRLAIEPEAVVYLFRPEVAQTVTWGGNPEKPVVFSEDSFRLGPRRSFELWKEEIRGTSLPWTRAEIAAAGELRKLILAVTLKQEQSGAD